MTQIKVSIPISAEVE